MKTIFYFLVFPGFLFALVVGMVASYIERKVTARVQWRVGPPILQPWYDLLKLFTKESVVPENAHLLTFLATPVLFMVSATLVAMYAGMAFFFPDAAFQGDLIVIVYLLTIPPICLILAGAASANPLASLGASREIKLVLSYELVFWMTIAVIWVKTGGELSLVNIMNKPPVMYSYSGGIASVLALFVMQAKLGRVPFDIAEAETEIMAGAYIEYSGPLLGFFKMGQYILLATLPFFISSIFWGGVNVFKYVALLVIVILVENTNPRLKVKQCLKLFWFILFPLSLVALILAVVGL